MTIEAAKKTAARKACEAIQDGMVLGLGTGSTAHHAIERIGELTAAGMSLVGVASSLATEDQARSCGIRLADLHEVDHIDLVIDGADEIDPRGNLIKGGGGALTREKLIALVAREMTVVADESKLVDRLGAAFRLPIAILPFGWTHTLERLASFGEPELRYQRSGDLPFSTDNGNHICDLRLPGGVAPEALAKLERDLAAIPGVVESGLFIGIATRAIIGTPTGETRELVFEV